MLTDVERAILLKYYASAPLTDAKRDELAQAYWIATKAERDEIARVYAHTFVDPSFVQRLFYFHQLLQRGGAGGGGSLNTNHGNGSSVNRSGGSSSSSNSQTEASPSFSTLDGPAPDAISPVMQSPTASPSGSPVFSPTAGHSSSRRTHAQKLLRSSIEEHFPKLTGSGPYAIAFGCVQTEAERSAVIDLYASQFLHPDPPELHRLVILPRSFSTRTRRRVSGSYSWYLRCLTTQEVVCAVTVTVHQLETIRFAEMPLFATGVGYKRNGFGRLLNAALLAWCDAAGLEFIMISADVQAIPFWRHLGYEIMTSGEKKRIAFFYQHDCYKFIDAEGMIGYCSRYSGRERRGGRLRKGEAANSQAARLLTPVPEILQQMPRFILESAITLPTD